MVFSTWRANLWDKITRRAFGCLAMAALSMTTAAVALHGTHHSSLSYLSASRPLRLPHNSVHVSRRPCNVCFNYPPSRARFSIRAAMADMDSGEGEEEGEEEEESEMTEDEITAAYEALYGPAYGGARQQKWISGFGEEGDDETVAGKGRRRKKGMDEGGAARVNRAGEGFEESVIQIRRVTKVVKGGKLMSFRAVVVIGDKMGKVGVGVGKAKEVLSAVQKSIVDAKRHLVIVPMTHSKTLPQRIDAKYGAAKVMLKPAATGTGVIAGGAVRVVLEMAGIENALGKQLGSDNPLNNARAVVEGINQIRNLREVAKARGAAVKDLWNC